MMANQKKPKLDESKSNDGKRPFSESDSETDQTYFRPSSSPIHFPRFIVIESLDSSNPVTKLSPFIVEKQLQSILGTPKSVKKLRNDTILVECFTRQQSENLLKHKKFYHLHVKIYPHNTLNSCKGVVRCKELSLCSIAEIHDGLKSQGVTDVKRISVRRNGETRTTNTYILTFSSPDLPHSVKIGYISAEVDLYIPNPMRCFKCQQYGHHISRCPRGPICAKCGTDEEDHSYDTCSNTLKCTNCKGSHAAFSRECPIWKEEKEILNIKYTKNVSFPEARQLVKQRQADQPRFSFSSSYSNVTAPTPVKENCQTCVILAKLVLKKFPDMKHELKDILPKQIFSVISPETSPSTGSTTSKTSSPTSKTSTPSSVTTSKTSSMISQQKLSSSLGKSNQAAEKAPSRPKTRVQLATDLPSASTFKDKTNLSEKQEIFETRVSDSEVSQLIDTEKSTRGKKKNRKSNERKITVKVGSPSISLSNRYEKLENSKDDIDENSKDDIDDTKQENEEMEAESDGSECDSPWASHRSEWNKDLQSWQSSVAEAKCIKK